MKAMPFGPTIRLLSCAASTMLLAGCPPAPGGSCLVGQPVTIPAADGTPPTVTVDFHVAGGGIVSVQSGGQVPAEVVSPNGRVTVIANGKDGEGVRDVQLWIGRKACTTDPATGAASCSGPGLLGAPTSSNRDGGAAGGTGCTERLVSENIDVLKTPTRAVSYEVTIRAENFGGGMVEIAGIIVRAQ